MINARGETLATRSAFRNAYARHRCLLPVNGFYEWQRDARRQAAAAHRHARTAARSGSPDCTSGGCRRTAKCSTRARSSRRRRATALRDVHERMPVIVPAARLRALARRCECRRRRPRRCRGPASRCACIRCRRASTRCATTMRRFAIRSTSRPMVGARAGAGNRGTVAAGRSDGVPGTPRRRPAPDATTNRSPGTPAPLQSTLF